jgi:hypothetical protein
MDSTGNGSPIFQVISLLTNLIKFVFDSILSQAFLSMNAELSQKFQFSKFIFLTLKFNHGIVSIFDFKFFIILSVISFGIKSNQHFFINFKISNCFSFSSDFLFKSSFISVL